MDPTKAVTPPATEKPIEISPVITSISEAQIVPEKPKKSSALFLVIGLLIFFLLVVTGIGGGYALVIVPRKTEVAFSKKLVAYFPGIRSSVGKVVTSFDGLYKLIVGQDGSTSQDGTKKLLRIDVTPFVAQLRELNKGLAQSSGEVAGVGTKRQTYLDHYNVYGKVDDVAEELKNVTRFGPNNARVLGITKTAAEDETAILRQAKEQTNLALSDTQAADTKLKEMQVYLITKRPGSLSTEMVDELQKVQTTSTQASEYLTEMYKTANYYHVLNDVNLEIRPLLASWVELLVTLTKTSQPELSMGQIDELHATLQGLDNRLIALDGDNLPKGINDLHSDNKKVVELLITNMEEIKSAVKKRDALILVNSIQILSQGLEPLTLRSRTREMSFWQDNPYFRKHDEVMQDIKSREDAIKKLITARLLPPFVN